MPDELDIVFIDSSILFAGSVSARGYARDLLVAGLQGSLTLVISTLVLHETERNLTRKAPHALPAFEILRTLLAPRIVDPPESLIHEVATMIDPKDAPIVAAAIHGQATYLATYDRRHLLSHSDLIADRYSVRIARPDAILGQGAPEQP
jgi:predicted nucleic acid-binding protein